MPTVPLGPANIDLTGIRAGDANKFTVTLTMKGVPLDLTGCTVTAQARKKAADQGDPALTAVVDVLDAPAGELAVRWPGADVAAVLGTSAKWSGVWDLQVSNDPAEDPTTVAAGKFEAEMDVTR